MPQAVTHIWSCKPGQKPMTGVVMGPSGRLLLFNKYDMPVNCLLNIHPYSHRSVLMSALGKEASICHGQWELQRLVSAPRLVNK